MNPNKALLEKGDFTRIAASMRESGESLFKTLGLTRGIKDLDLGCGDGTTVQPAARLSAYFVGVDIAKNLVNAGNERARGEGLDCDPARVTRRRLIPLDEVLATEGDDLSDEERAALHRSIDESIKDEDAGNVEDLSRIIAELRAQL